MLPLKGCCKDLGRRGAQSTLPGRLRFSPLLEAGRNTPEKVKPGLKEAQVLIRVGFATPMGFPNEEMDGGGGAAVGQGFMGIKSPGPRQGWKQEL